MNFNEELISIINSINDELSSLLPKEDIEQKNIIDAMKYSVEAGGKRLRPVLSIAVSRLLGGKDEDILPFAAALEMIHTYSLIHDDLPCMDNDDYRRGKLTNHKVFGEAIAVLAGDGLLNRAFEVMIDAALMSDNKCNALKAMEVISNASSYHGMVGGQVIDMEIENKKVPRDLLEKMHSLKTGAMIRAAILAPAYYYGASDSEIKALDGYARNLGLGFQIKDDILDVIGDDKLLGKKTGSDSVNGKTTFVTLLGLEESQKVLESFTHDAINSLDIFKSKADFLKNIAEYLLKREN